jgi:hypothetical protein
MIEQLCVAAVTWQLSVSALTEMVLQLHPDMEDAGELIQ